MWGKEKEKDQLLTLAANVGSDGDCCIGEGTSEGRARGFYPLLMTHHLECFINLPSALIYFLVVRSISTLSNSRLLNRGVQNKVISFY